MALVRLTLAFACALLWAVTLSCASAPASQPTADQTEPRRPASEDVAAVSAPQPTPVTVSSDNAKTTPDADSTNNAAGMTSAQVSHPSPAAGPAMAAAADTSNAEIDCTDEANRCDPACLTAVPSSRLLLPNVGDDAYGFDLPSTAGPTYSLASYRGESNVVLVFYRAFW